MRAYSGESFKYKELLRSTTKTAKIIAKNADRSKKKRVRTKAKIEMMNQL